MNESRHDVLARWEWRTFFEGSLPDVVRDLVGHAMDGAAASAETYVLSLPSPNDVKIRDGRLEIKTLQETDRALERWRPTLVAAFPVDAGDIRDAFEAWMVPPPVVMRRHASIDDFLLDVVRPEALLRVVRLTKRRARLQLLGCAAECASLDVDGATWYTLALEDADSARLAEAVSRLPLGPRVNTSYPAALKKIAGFTSTPALAAEEVIW